MFSTATKQFKVHDTFRKKHSIIVASSSQCTSNFEAEKRFGQDKITTLVKNTSKATAGGAHCSDCDELGSSGELKNLVEVGRIKIKALWSVSQSRPSRHAFLSFLLELAHLDTRSILLAEVSSTRRMLSSLLKWYPVRRLPPTPPSRSRNSHTKDDEASENIGKPTAKTYDDCGKADNTKAASRNATLRSSC